jgi:hypothetical protein
MTHVGRSRDLVVLAADKNAEFALRGLLSRHHALDIRPVAADIYVHPERDPGCLLKSDAFLAAFLQSHSHAMVIFDREGCGKEHLSPTELADQVESALERKGWTRRHTTAIILDPELEIWVWSDSPEVDVVLGWQGRDPNLRAWLATNQYIVANIAKPQRPKEAMQAALRQVRQARSSSLFQRLAETVSFDRCDFLSF